MYSEKLKVAFTKARFPFFIHGDVFEVKVPLFYGETLILSNQNPMNGGRTLNTLDMIQDLSEPLRQSLTSSDVNQLQAYFVTCLKVL